jgi:hypothetical protein
LLVEERPNETFKMLGDESKGLHNRRAKFHQSFLIKISF